MHNERVIWSIGAPDLVGNYDDPGRPGDVVYRVPHAGMEEGPQQWPLFHPSEADPEAGYRLYTYAVEFVLDQEPVGEFELRLDYLVIAPRLASLEVRVGGESGRVYLRPRPSVSGEIRLRAGLHTTIYSEGTATVAIPSRVLCRGMNRMEFLAHDEGEVLRVERIDAIKRLDRMANGAGFIYEGLSLVAVDRVAPRVVVEPTVLYRAADGGGLVERCYVHAEECPPGSYTVALSTGDSVPFAVGEGFGHVRVAFDLPDGEGPVRWSVRSLACEGSFVRRRKWQVYVAPHAHTDIGYTHRQWEVAERLSRVVDDAMRIIAQDPSAYAFHLDSAWTLENYLATRGPERLDELRRLLREGKVGVSGTYVDLLTHLCGLEDLIRNCTVAADLLDTVHASSDFAAVVDVASITSAFPTVLEGAGVKYLAHADNQDRGPFRLNGGLHRHSPFWWEGIGGGRVLVWLAKMYCELRKVCGSPPVLHSGEQGLEMWLHEYEHAAYAPDAVLLYGQEADNTDVDPQPASFIRQWNETWVYPRLVPSDVSSFFRYVEGKFGDRLPVFRGDSGAYWEDGAGSSMAETIAVRGAQAALPAAERLEALAVLHALPGFAFPAAQFDEAWKQVLLYDEHTWGAFLSCTEPDALLAEDQWAVKQGFARQSALQAQRLLHVAACRHSLQWNTDGREVVVYNPHSWAMSGAVTVEIEPSEVLVDPATGEEAPVRRVRSMRSQAVVELWVSQLEGLSYRRYRLVRRGAPVLAAPVTSVSGVVVLENEHYRVTVNTALGAAMSWFDKALGRELANGAFGQLLYAKGGEGTRLISNQADLPPGNPAVLADFQLSAASVVSDAVAQRLVLSGNTPCGPLTVEWSLPSEGGVVDVSYRLEKVETRAKEAVYVAFPLDLPGAAVSSDAQLGWVDWHRDQLPGGCKEWLPLQTSILVEGTGAGVQICSPDIPLFCVGDVVRGRWPVEADLTGGRIYSYVLNNYWHTNYKASQGGPLTWRYRLTSAPALDRAAAYRLGWEARRPLYGHRISFQDFRSVAAPYDSPTGGLLARVSPESVAMSTMKAARAGEGMIVRLQEIAGLGQIASVAFPGRPVARAWVTDLLERDKAPLLVQPDGSLRVAVPAWGLSTVRILFA